jgi:hypothetical protein
MVESLDSRVRGNDGIRVESGHSNPSGTSHTRSLGVALTMPIWLVGKIDNDQLRKSCV